MFYAIQPNFLSAWRSMSPISIHPLFSYQDYWARTWARPPLRSARSSVDFLQPSSSLFTWLKVPLSDGFYLTAAPSRKEPKPRPSTANICSQSTKNSTAAVAGPESVGRSGFGCPFPSRENKWLHVSLHPFCVSPFSCALGLLAGME